MGQSVACEDSSSLFFLPTVQVHMWKKCKPDGAFSGGDVLQNINEMVCEFQT